MKEKTTRVQELYVWEPTELELELVSIYSPAHALIWLGMGSSNWVLSLLVMVVLSLQVSCGTLLVHCKLTGEKDKCLDTLLQSPTEGQAIDCCGSYERVQ